MVGGSRHSWQTRQPADWKMEGCRVAFRASEPRTHPRLRSPAASPPAASIPPTLPRFPPLGQDLNRPPPKTCIRPNNVIGRLDVVSPPRYLVVNHAAPRHRRATESSSPFSDLESSPSPIARFLALSPLFPRPPTPLPASRRARDAVVNFVRFFRCWAGRGGGCEVSVVSRVDSGVDADFESRFWHLVEPSRRHQGSPAHPLCHARNPCLAVRE